MNFGFGVILVSEAFDMNEKVERIFRNEELSLKGNIFFAFLTMYLLFYFFLLKKLVDII